MPDKRFALKYDVKALSESRGEVMVYSVISMYKWDDDTVTSNSFDKSLKALGDVKEIVIRINSIGGTVTEAVAIRTALMKHPAKKTIDIEGACDSAATIIACLPGARVRMAKGGDYMIHRSSWSAWGHADAMLAAYNSLTNTDNDLADIYAERTGMTKEKCLELMTAETWYNAEQAMEAGFVDEIIQAEEAEEPITACAGSPDETEKLMRAYYAHAPESAIKNACAQMTGKNNVSNEPSAVAADNSTENNNEGVEKMELKEATAEQLQQENPELAQTIAQQAVAAERERMQRIDKLTPKGAKFAELAKKAKEEGTSVEDYLAQVIEAQDKAGGEYLEARAKETEKAGNVGGGDTKDHDGGQDDKVDKAAKDIAELAKGMTTTNTELA